MGKKRADARKTEEAAVLAVADGSTCEEALWREGGIDCAVTCATCAVAGTFKCGEGIVLIRRLPQHDVSGDVLGLFKGWVLASEEAARC